MVALRTSDSHPRSARAPRHERAAWLVLALGGPASELPALVAGTGVWVTADPRRFRDVLLAERPRIVVVCQPPAGDEVMDLVASERRRRSRLRAMHLAPADAVSSRMAALARGFDDALTTEVTGDELAARLAWLEGRARERPGGTILPVADGVELDPVAHVLRRDGIAVHLRPKEYGLLALLASHPGRAYARRELLERVWGRGIAGPGRTVDVHVRWLRSKIEPDPDHPIHLVTVRCVGYRLDPPGR
ncbi:MAG TPA: response regulator transcription factor [Candidatus Limnocylindrales bacterium]|nr:response regulator transcription factor [Candidatus Limnocylindrales bacterium]